MERRSGNTTRIADSDIQEFFNTGRCMTIDHHGTTQACQRLYDIVLNRLYTEHHIKSEDLILDRSHHIIRMKHKYNKN